MRRRSGGRGTMVVVLAATAGTALTGCIAPDVEVIGAIGVMVDEESRPVLVVEPCDGAAVHVDLHHDRQGLADDEENEQVGSWDATAPVEGTSELVLHAPSDPWDGEGVEISPDRGYIATGQGQGETDVLSQVAFRGSDLAAMEAGTVYRNDMDPDVTTLVARSPEEFSAETCSRG
ncbi:hypothetical protein [Ornithinimicrobium pekingense]|uniref:Uncharacterized protein n=1 Tax=Ornithinimicrobium pekingense TaxID=384677 RepID=A0ABQ2F738_9MICO|nr:hypothetical protein [Ornithinimicrobium pekingense]GGK67779.1 hypothetical protein GCM10011509_15190 [Ornithinimicrobium pekingense]